MEQVKRGGLRPGYRVSPPSSSLAGPRETSRDGPSAFIRPDRTHTTQLDATRRTYGHPEVETTNQGKMVTLSRSCDCRRRHRVQTKWHDSEAQGVIKTQSRGQRGNRKREMWVRIQKTQRLNIRNYLPTGQLEYCQGNEGSLVQRTTQRSDVCHQRLA